MLLGTILIVFSGETIPTGVQTQLTDGTATIDTLGIWDPANPDQFIVPASCTKIRILIQAKWGPPATGGVMTTALSRALRNGAHVDTPQLFGAGLLLTATPPGYSAALSTTTTGLLIAATPGDIWTASGSQGSGQDTTVITAQLGAEFYT